MLAWLTLSLLGIGVPMGAPGRAPSQAVPHVAVAHAPEAIGPGDAVFLTITAAGPLGAVSGQALGQPLNVFPGGQPHVWHALVGIDIGTAPGTYPVTLIATGKAGSSLRAVHTLKVGPRTFGVRRLRVPQKFVTPPPSELARIDREQKRLAGILSKVSEPRLWRGAFEKPVDGPMVSAFGVRSDYNGKQGTPHRGTDFAGATGTDVRAPGAGRVVLAADLYFSGNTVVIDHGLGLFSLLAHLSRVDVSEGDLVAAGSVVGAVGATGRVTGPHLHWSVRIGRASVDPLSLIAATAASRGE